MIKAVGNKADQFLLRALGLIYEPRENSVQWGPRGFFDLLSWFVRHKENSFLPIHATAPAISCRRFQERLGKRTYS
jgi:hypothetical protein